MAAMIFFGIVKNILQFPQMVGDPLDEGTRDRMQQRAEYLDQQMMTLLQELEHGTMEQDGGVWGALLWAVLGLVLGLLWQLRKRSNEVDIRGEAGSSCKEREESEGGNRAEKDLATKLLAPPRPTPTFTLPTPIPTALTPFTPQVKWKGNGK
ncbi:hypothetical protein BTVI_26779 [Pitangus sulphuratus]|nr:hypothetical protein BTVI_26779 [Pitangus sulphuratus]